MEALREELKGINKLAEDQRKAVDNVNETMEVDVEIKNMETMNKNLKP